MNPDLVWAYVIPMHIHGLVLPRQGPEYASRVSASSQRLPGGRWSAAPIHLSFFVNDGFCFFFLYFIIFLKRESLQMIILI